MPARAVQIAQFRVRHERAGHTEPIAPDGRYTRGCLGFPRLQKARLTCREATRGRHSAACAAAGPVLGGATAMRGMAFGRLERIDIDRAIAPISDHAT